MEEKEPAKSEREIKKNNSPRMEGEVSEGK